MLDELGSGVPAAGSPAIQHGFGTSYATTAAMLLLAPSLLALVLEPIVFLYADRYPRRWFLRGGLAAMALCALAAAFAPGPLSLAIAVSLSAVATGTAVTLAQATLVDRAGEARELAMTRWAMAGLAGDLLGALLVSAVPWRIAYAIVAALLGAWTLAAFRIADPPAAPDDDDGGDDLGLFAALRLALGDRRLLAWLAALALCDLLDEILIVFASLHLRDDLGAGAFERGVALSAFIAGGAIGLAVIARLLRTRPPVPLLGACAAACAIVYAGWLAAPSWWLAAIALAAVGATAAPLYPIAAARAYAVLPGRSGAVNAAGHLFTPFGMVVPWLIGVVADRAGLRVALGLLALEPIGIALLAVSAARSGTPRRPDRAS